MAKKESSMRIDGLENSYLEQEHVAKGHGEDTGPNERGAVRTLAPARSEDTGPS